MNKEFYTIKEIADKMSVSTRTIERMLKGLLSKEKNKILIPFDIVSLLEHRHNSDTTPTTEYDVLEAFSNEEYKEFQKRLIEYPILKKDLEYHRKASESHQLQMEKILSILQERNHLEAFEKTKLKKGN